jgi:hypothetical protein
VQSVAGGLEWTALADAGVEFTLPAKTSFDVTVFQNAFFQVGDARTLQFLAGQPAGLERGQGHAVGLELSLRRTLAKHLRGFVSYTLSRSTRSIGRVTSPSTYDRSHVLDGALAYDFGVGWKVSARATFYTGFPARVAAVTQLGSSPRSTEYFQLDWQLAKRFSIGSHGSWWGFTMGVLNTTLSQESNDMVCSPTLCSESLVGPATIPTIGVEGEI